jgi:hypothetical protein
MKCTLANDCWCAQLPQVPIPVQHARCLCPNCLWKEIDLVNQNDSQWAESNLYVPGVPEREK